MLLRVLELLMPMLPFKNVCPAVLIVQLVLEMTPARLVRRSSTMATVWHLVALTPWRSQVNVMTVMMDVRLAQLPLTTA